MHLCSQVCTEIIKTETACVYLLDDVTTGDNKTRVSRSMAERGPARGEMNKGRHLGRTKQSKKICRV